MDNEIEESFYSRGKGIVLESRRRGTCAVGNMKPV
jgi:hypothetical protein